MIRVLQILSVAAVVSFLGFDADASDPFRSTSDSSAVSTSSLSDMGLSGMKTLSNDDAKQIRGQGAIVWGGSYAYVWGAGSVNGYLATGNYVAGGANLSFAGNRRGTVYAGGFSIAGGF
jgi:hypothetical protein